MSDGPVGSYTFLPWLRRGLAARIARLDAPGGAAAPRARLPVSISLDTSEGARTATANLALQGPGEVKSLDPRVVVRRFPRPGEADAQPDYFAHVEFDQADLPWRHTAARATERDRLRPWLVLAVLAEDEIASREPPSAEGRLPAITVAAANLPDLEQSWAWAHAQVSALGPADAATILTVLDREPDRAVARLLCPRRLAPQTRYVAVLVPAFERGRRAALQETLDEGVDALEPAWDAATGSVRLPVYDEWHFTTGVSGDFETLARRLRPWPAPETLGMRDLDVAEPGMGLPAAAPGPLQMESALLSPLARAGRVEGVAASAEYLDRLRALVEAPTDLLESGGDPVVAPPLYGRWYAAVDRLASPPVWFHDLNADPRFRAGCGLGTSVVQAEQTQLMAGAWEQVQGILELAEKYRQAQLARELAERVRQRHVAPLDPETALLVTAPLHPRVRASPETVAAVLQRSPIAGGVGEGQLRRVTRPLGPVARRQRRGGRRGPAPTLLARMNRGEIDPAPRPATAPEIGTHERVAGTAAPRSASPGALAFLERAPALLWVVAIGLVVLVALALPAFGATQVVLLALAAAAAVTAVRLARTLPRRRLRAALRTGTLDPEDVRHAPAPAGFVPRLRPPGAPGPAATSTRPGTPAARESVARFRAALADLHAGLGTPLEVPPPLVPARLAALRESVLRAVDPHATIALPLRSRTRFAPWVVWDYPADPIEPPMPAPLFEQPMYEPLRDLSADWILAGAGEMPGDTASLLETNQRFVEAYMVGCNHEMTRELRYHEFPIDQRGTYFRQFWDVRGSVPEEGRPLDPEALRDIRPVHAWAPAGRLGDHSPRRPPPGGAHLVLTVKGELFRRYPNTIVYACRARVGGPADGPDEGRRVLGEEQKHPVFRGRLDPDIRFFGFELSAADARGGGADPGWFFVLQEQPSEPLFGLDKAEAFGRRIESWDDLSWGDLVDGPDALAGLSYVDLDAPRPDTTLVPAASGAVWHADAGLGAAGATAADLAYITLQRPFRVGIHGADLLPGAGP